MRPAVPQEQGRAHRNGGVVTGIQSFYKTINGKVPVLVGVAPTGVDGTQKNSVVLFGDSSHVLGPIGTYASKYLHAKTAAVLYPNQAATTVGGQAIIAGLKAAGVSVKSATYDEGNAAPDRAAAELGRRDSGHRRPVLRRRGLRQPGEVAEGRRRDRSGQDRLGSALPQR